MKCPAGMALDLAADATPRQDSAPIPPNQHPTPVPVNAECETSAPSAAKLVRGVPLAGKAAALRLLGATVPRPPQAAVLSHVSAACLFGRGRLIACDIAWLRTTCWMPRRGGVRSDRHSDS